MFKDFLITGHPRSGTSYSSHLFNTFGFSVGHEVIGSDGISSWCFGSDKGFNLWTDKSKRNEYTFKYTFLNVRHPLSIINSYIQLNYEDKMPTILMELWGNFKISQDSKISTAVDQYLKWDNYLWEVNKIDYWFRVEDQQKFVYDTLTSLGCSPHYPLGENNINKDFLDRSRNTRPKSFPPITLEDIPSKYQMLLMEKIQFYGYE